MALAKTNLYAKIVLEKYSGSVNLRFASFNLPEAATLDPTGGVAFAQPPATSLYPDRMKPDDVGAMPIMIAILRWRHQCIIKTLIWQKDRTQKNVSRIFLRSMFLPIQVDLFGPSRFPRTRNRQENGGKNLFPALHFHAPIFMPIPNRTTSHPRFLACSILQVDGTVCLSRTKTLIWLKDRTQKNESGIFLRSIFLPIQVDLIWSIQVPSDQK
jgi:hypothetical protein